MIYEPREDSFLLEREVRKFAKGRTFLDMGAGSGIQSRAALDVKAKSVLAADISDEAIKILKRQKIPALKSDLFSNINGKFDIIAFNPPYLPEDLREDKSSSIATSGGRMGNEIIIRFLDETKKHLTGKGIILLVVSSLTPKKAIISLLKKQKMKKEVISSEKLFFEELEIWKISNK